MPAAKNIKDRLRQNWPKPGLLGRHREVGVAVLHGLDGHRYVAVPRDEDHRDDRALEVQLLLQLQPAHAGHPHVQHQAARLRGVVGGEELAGRRVGLDGQAH